MDERPVKIDLIGSVWDAAWSIFSILGWIYLAFAGIRSFVAGNPNTGFSKPPAMKGFQAPAWSRPPFGSLLWNALVSGIILACTVGFFGSCNAAVFWSTLGGWIAFRLILGELQVRRLSRRYRARPDSFRLLVDCMVRPGSRYAVDIRRNGITGPEWGKSPMWISPESQETMSVVGPKSDCPDMLKAHYRWEFEQANADARSLGFQDIFDFTGYRMYWQMVSDPRMATDDRKDHIGRWIEQFDGCGFTDADLKRWHGFLNSVGRTWDLKPYVPSAETDVHPDPFATEGESISDEELHQAADEGAKSMATEGSSLFQYTVSDNGREKKGRLYARDQAEAIHIIQEMGYFPTSLEEQ